MAVQGQRRQRPRGGRQEPDAGYGAPQPQYGEAASDSLAEGHSGDHQGLDWLLESVPGTPGEDYPILAEVPETGFSCDGQVEGGKYYRPGQPNWEYSIWKFQDFSATQILREINLGHFEAPKTTNWTI